MSESSLIPSFNLCFQQSVELWEGMDSPSVIANQRANRQDDDATNIAGCQTILAFSLVLKNPLAGLTLGNLH